MLRLHPLQRGPRLPRVYPGAGSTRSMDALLPAAPRLPRFAWSARVAPQDWQSSRCSAWTSDNSMSNGNPILGPMFGCGQKKKCPPPLRKITEAPTMACCPGVAAERTRPPPPKLALTARPNMDRARPRLTW